MWVVRYQGHTSLERCWNRVDAVVDDRDGAGIDPIRRKRLERARRDVEVVRRPHFDPRGRLPRAAGLARDHDCHGSTEGTPLVRIVWHGEFDGPAARAC